jgi:hypothetical protein
MVDDTGIVFVYCILPYLFYLNAFQKSFAGDERKIAQN